MINNEEYQHRLNLAENYLFYKLESDKKFIEFKKIIKNSDKLDSNELDDYEKLTAKCNKFFNELMSLCKGTNTFGLFIKLSEALKKENYIESEKIKNQINLKLNERI